jgi:hypothetical protein
MDDKTKDEQPRWHGDEVEDAPGDEAEQAASRAEGNAPVRADAEVARSQPPSVDNDENDDADDDDGRRQAATADDPEGAITDAADEHRTRRDAGERPPRGKL